MIGINNLPSDILQIIIEYISCPCLDRGIFLSNKYFNNILKNKCIIISYKDLDSCKFDNKNKDKIRVIETLKDCENRVSLYGYLNSLYFLNNKQYKIAEPYLYNFGEVSHKSTAPGSYGVIYKSIHSHGITSYGFTDTQEELINEIRWV